MDEREAAGLRTFLAERRRLIGVAQAVVGSRAVAEELVQESWLRWHGRNYASDEAPSIFRRIVRNLALDWVRRSQSERRSLDAALLTGLEVPTAERLAIGREDVAIADAALAELPERTRLAFRMNRIEGRTYAEIGEALGISAPRAHQLVRQALLHVAVRLDR
ncbi:MAG: RNA polymerase sigma factor [Pseudomonadota bacterium]